MKLSSLFNLYKSYYPAIPIAHVTIANQGSMMQLSDARRTFRLNLFTRKGAELPVVKKENPMIAQFLNDNRREMFMLNETRSLYGIVYAENLGYDLKMIALSSDSAALPRHEDEGIRLTYLFALGDKLTRSRYSVSSITLERKGSALITAETRDNVTAIKIDAGGRVFAGNKGDIRATESLNPDVMHYSRLFWRDNAEWFANFAAGRTDML